MDQTLPDEQSDSSHKPSFYMCCQTRQRMKADILMLTKECDYRLFVKTSKKFNCFYPGRKEVGGTWVNVCWKFATGLSEHLPH